jgi:hypothetical protein
VFSPVYQGYSETMLTLCHPSNDESVPLLDVLPSNNEISQCDTKHIQIFVRYFTTLFVKKKKKVKLSL